MLLYTLAAATNPANDLHSLSSSPLIDYPFGELHSLKQPALVGMELTVSRTTVLGVIVVLLLVLKLTKTRRKTADAPGIGYGSLPILGPWFGAFTFMKDPQGTINKAVAQYKGGYFRMSSHALEYLIVADKDKTTEYLSAPEDHLSFHDQLNEFLQVEWTLGYGIAARPYHIGVIRTKLTQSIANSVPSMLLEIQEVSKAILGSPKGIRSSIYGVD